MTARVKKVLADLPIQLGQMSFWGKFTFLLVLVRGNQLKILEWQSVYIIISDRFDIKFRA